MSKKLEINLDELEESRIPRAFWKKDVDTYKGDVAALKEVTKYVKSSRANLEMGRGLLIVGPRDSCKTFLVSSALKTLIAKGHSVRYMHMEDMTESAFANESSFNQLRLIDFVAIDNLDGDNFHQGHKRVISRLIKLRRDEGLPVIFVASVDIMVYGRTLELYAETNAVTVRTGDPEDIPEDAETVDSKERERKVRLRDKLTPWMSRH